MAATTQDILMGLAADLDELKRVTGAELLILRTIIKAAIPYLSNDARISIDRAVRAASETVKQDDPDVDWIRVQLAPMELDSLLPIHRAGWSGIPDPPPRLQP
jgi:hypothetical protein